MSEAPAIGLGIVLVAIVAVLAGGAGASNDSDAGASASDAPAAAGATGTGPCSGLDTVTSDGGGIYAQYPVSGSNSLGCTLGPGDRGEPVAALQRALALCLHRKVSPDGAFGTETSRALTALGSADGSYGPVVAKAMTWPWFSASTRSFTGR
jgi:peptidoglycan hydrolase-like protein with peptidoglycan-binding domain